VIRRLLLPSLFACLYLAAWPAGAQNLVNGKEIHDICSGCHGKHAQGGKGGEYPRRAGQRAAYIEEQLLAFRTKKRLNIPMLPYTQPRELSDQDIVDVAAYLSAIPLTTKPPVFTSSQDARARRIALDRVFVIERAEGDITQGAGIYNTACAGCHAKNGRGRSSFPMLVGQYPNYLKRQIEAFRRGDRPHDEDEPRKGTLMALSDVDIDNILAHLTAIQDQEP
jgi:cytochrome c553